MILSRNGARQAPRQQKTEKTPSRDAAAETQQPEEPAAYARPTVFLPLSINEVMLSNKATLADENGLFPDWVELYNYGSEPLSLGGLLLWKDDEAWPLPDRQLAPGAYLVVFCDGGDGLMVERQFFLPQRTSILPRQGKLGRQGVDVKAVKDRTGQRSVKPSRRNDRKGRKPTLPLFDNDPSESQTQRRGRGRRRSFEGARERRVLVSCPSAGRS